MNLLVLLLAASFVGSLQSVQFLGRVVTVGDFGFAAIIPLVLYLAHRQSALGRQVLGWTEISMGALLALLPVTAYLARSLGDGTFLNGYRSLVFAGFTYVAGRLIVTDGAKVRWACMLTFAAVGAVLYQSGTKIADFRGGLDVTHLVGYEAEGLGSNLRNLNVLGMLWCSVACLAVPMVADNNRGARLFPVVVGLAMLAFVSPGVVKSFSRSAYFYFVIVLIGFFFVLIRGRRNLVAVAAPFVATSLIFSLVSSVVSGLTSTSIDRVAEKMSGLSYELGYRINELLLDPMVTFLSDTQGASLLLGVYNSPQHSSLSHYLVMFGAFGFLAYVFFQAQLIADGLRVASRLDSHATGGRALATYSSLLATFLLLNDLATNALYYNPTFCYLAYFLLGLSRPYLVRHGR